ncbi:hypothetical protein L6452_05640 [Arctium lappa]|uniref:Uncharacterized protein n=1 Tax=Arctium lappa TaxID=4217 RepID=A0ACB9EGY2_ARCLA|nr:hypothetical protein L6452_05640 [Arctium lappa]
MGGVPAILRVGEHKEHSELSQPPLELKSRTYQLQIIYNKELDAQRRYHHEYNFITKEVEASDQQEASSEDVDYDPKEPPITPTQPFLTQYSHNTPLWASRLERKLDQSTTKVGGMRASVENIEQQLADRGYGQGQLTVDGRHRARRHRQNDTSSSNQPGSSQ